MKTAVRIIVLVVAMVILTGCPKSLWQTASKAKTNNPEGVPIAKLNLRAGKWLYNYKGSKGGEITTREKDGNLIVAERSYGSSNYDGHIDEKGNRIWIEDDKLFITHNFSGHAYTWVFDKAYRLDDGTILLVGKATWSGGEREVVLRLDN